MNLRSPISEVKGVGKKTAAQLGAGGIETIEDMINFLPRTYEDYTGAENIADIKPGKVVIRARAKNLVTRYTNRNLRITTATLEDNHGDQIKAVWFNQPYRVRQLESGAEFYFSGNYALQYGSYQLVTPTCEAVRGLPVTSDKIVPIYSMRAGLKPSTTKKIIANLKPLMSMLPETLPSSVVSDVNLMAHCDAVKEMHFPTSRQTLTEAKRRLSFEELYLLILAAKMNRNENQRIKGYSMPFEKGAIQDFVSHLPFTMTDAQRRASWEIIKDLEKPSPMNRLLQGDVGSGKTVVAALTAYQAIASGYQVAMMVPTEVLAAQHAATLEKLLTPLGVKIGLLTSSVKGKCREELLASLKSGSTQLIVGTHALFQETVEFSKLGYVIIDEQHRFGVKQRQSLQTKTNDGHLPHLLSMTATPIPRSLQLTVFGDLDVSILNELPKGRQKIETKVVLPNARKPMVEQIKNELGNGHQIYYVAKLIEESSTSDKTSAEVLYKKVLGVYRGARVGILHGKMAPEAKDKVMREFEQHDLDILVATTVIEVGVDVPNATVMVIENADQFGLAQLHQLRGRVGRGNSQSFCYLVQSNSDQPTKRLREIERSNDGFHLAEVDLAMRGAGEIYGTAQHGDLNLKIANLADTRMIKLASVEADKTLTAIINDANYLDNYPYLKDAINKYQKVTTLN